MRVSNRYKRAVEQMTLLPFFTVRRLT